MKFAGAGVGAAAGAGVSGASTVTVSPALIRWRLRTTRAVDAHRALLDEALGLGARSDGAGEEGVEALALVLSGGVHPHPGARSRRGGR